MVYCQNSTEFEQAKTVLFTDSTSQANPQFLDYIKKSYMGRVEVWATHVRIEKKIPTHGMNTAAYSENSFGITKDEIFQREKCFNFPDMLRLLLDENSRHWTRKCVQIANNRFIRFKQNKSKYIPATSGINLETIVDLGNKCFMVESETTGGKLYYVDMITGFCSCPCGVCCSPCKHKSAVAYKFGIAEFSVIPTMDPKSRALFYYLGTGKQLPDWHFRPLSGKEMETAGAKYVEEVTQETIPNDGRLRNFVPEVLDIEEEAVVINYDINIERDNTGVEDLEIEREETDKKVTLEDFMEKIEAFKIRIENRLDNNKISTKSLKSFNLSMKHVLEGNDSKLQDTLFKFTKEKYTRNRNNSGRKKQKTGKAIPTQMNRRNMRTYKQKGKKTSASGRRPDPTSGSGLESQEFSIGDLHGTAYSMGSSKLQKKRKNA